MRILLIALPLALTACGSRGAPPNSTGPGLKRFEVRTFSSVHANGTLAVAFMAGNRRAISSGVDDTASIWEIPSGIQAKKFSGPQYRFQSIAFSADGSFALTPAPNGSVNYWNIESGQLQRTFTGGTTLGAVALSSDGKWVAAGGQDQSIHLWDFSSNSGTPAQELTTGAPVARLGFTAENLHAVLGDGRVCVWTLDAPKPQRCAEAISEPISQAAFSADGHRTLIGSRLGTLLLWDVGQAAEIRKLQGSQGDIVAIAFSPNGKYGPFRRRR
jgi:WD40 repeat protein